MNRNDLQNLTKIRLREARILIINGNYDGAYYLCGIALECAIKSCIAKKTKEHDFPNLNFVKDSYQHDLTKLIKVAGLDITNEINNNSNFKDRWDVVKEWSIESRYMINKRNKDAVDMYYSIVNRNNGVLKWIKEHW
jgi:HEPN domain-containing protein